MRRTGRKNPDDRPDRSVESLRAGACEFLVKTRIAVVIACHNRRDTTLRCLRSLHDQESANVAFDLFLLDDGSTDGTSMAVLEEFPQTHILPGTGQLFWGGGMRVGMQAALGSQFDFMLWLNDDVVLRPQAIIGMLKAYDDACQSSEHDMNVVVGCMQDPDTGMISYSGFLNSSRWHPTRLHKVVPSRSEPKTCDTLNGNLVLLPRLVVDRIGIIDAAFPHQLGDIDYGYRVGRAGGKVFLAPGIAGHCASNPGRVLPGKFLDRLRYLASPRGLPIKAWATFFWRYAGLLGIPLLVAMYAKVIFFRPGK